MPLLLSFLERLEVIFSLLAESYFVTFSIVLMLVLLYRHGCKNLSLPRSAIQSFE